MLLRFDLKTNSTFSGTGAHIHSSLSLISLKDTMAIMEEYKDFSGM